MEVHREIARDGRLAFSLVFGSYGNFALWLEANSGGKSRKERQFSIFPEYLLTQPAALKGYKNLFVPQSSMTQDIRPMRVGVETYILFSRTYNTF